MLPNYEPLESLSDAVPAVIAVVGRDLRHRVCNLAYAEWFGRRRENVIGSTVEEVVGAALWKQLEPEIQETLAGEPRRFDGELPRDHAGRRFFSATLTPHLQPGGEVDGIAIFLQDITEQRRREDELRQSGERYRSLFNSIDEGFCVIEVLFDAAGTPVDYYFHEVNPAFEKQAGMTKVVGKRMLEFVASIESHWLRNYGHVALTGEPIRFAEEYKGLNRWFDVYAFRVGRPGERKVAVLFNDITQEKRNELALRESESRFRNMADNSPMMLWVTEADGRCTHLNRRWYEFTGQTPETGLGFGWLQAVHPEDRARAEHDFLTANSSRQPFRAEYRLRRKDGEYHWAIDAATPRFSETGEYLGYIGSVIDIEDRKRVELALREAKEQAEQASRAKDSFLAQLSHELRTPLTPVLMTASAMAEDEHLAPEMREQLTMIARNIALEARLIDDLLDLTRITHGKLALRAEPCDVHQLLQLVVEIIREESREKRVDIVLRLEASRHRLVADSARLQQVFWNLLRNAVKFTHEGGRVEIRSANVPGTDAVPRIRVEVCDNGIGFVEQEAGRFFQPFERGNAGKDQRFPGLGLGLAIAKAVVDGHGGTIQASSGGPGTGACFTVDLPGTRAGSSPPLETHASPPAVTTARAPMHLLLVEDHPPTALVLSRLLTRFGHRVTSAGSVAEALAAANREKIDFVVSDLGLPDGTGIELMVQLRQQHGLSGIALSGYGMDDDRRRTKEAGFVAHLTKPVNFKEIAHALELASSDPGLRRS
jgi:PAS domain S-box-containing protein